MDLLIHQVWDMSNREVQGKLLVLYSYYLDNLVQSSFTSRINFGLCPDNHLLVLIVVAYSSFIHLLGSCFIKEQPQISLVHIQSDCFRQLSDKYRCYPQSHLVKLSDMLCL